MTLWRIHLKPDGVDSVEFCLERNILGMGWWVESCLPLDWDTYYKLAEAKYVDTSWRSNLMALHGRMKYGDLCWTRDRNGKYYLGRVEGEWEYCGHKEEYENADIVNVRSCQWFRAGEADSVPGKVLNGFRPSRTVQRVWNKTALFYSRYLYNKLYNEHFGRQIYDLSGHDELDLLALVGPEDCEDIVGIYLQEKLGYRMIPSSCKHATVKTEFILKSQEGKRANVQVKQGWVDLNRDDYDDYDDPLCEWFLFTTQGKYTGREHRQVHCLSPDDMRHFAFNNRNLMTQRVQTFIRFIESASQDDRAENRR